MPTYEYRCPNGHAFEKFYRKISDAGAEVACPECGAPAARQLSAGAGLLFKGSGFYLTDYGKNAHRTSAPGAPGAPAAKSDAGGGESKGGESKGGESKGGDSGGGAAGGEGRTAKGGDAATGGESRPAASKPAANTPAGPAPKKTSDS